MKPGMLPSTNIIRESIQVRLKIENIYDFSYTQSMEIMSARDLSKYLKINEKKIYKLAQEATIPYIKIGGKVAFAKELIDKWIMENTQKENQIGIAGSDDWLVRKVIDIWNYSVAKNNGVIYYAPVGSINGLKLLANNAASMSCVHILDVEKKAYTLSYINRYLAKDGYKAVYLFDRSQGFFLKKHNPKGIRTLKDIAREDVKFVNRNRGSGTRLLFDFLLRESNIDQADIHGYNEEVESHMEAGLTVLQGTADVAFGMQHLAHILDLDFVPLFQERFDLVIPTDYFYSPLIKAFLTFFEQPTLAHYVKDFTGYDLKNVGSILEPDV